MNQPQDKPAAVPERTSATPALRERGYLWVMFGLLMSVTILEGYDVTIFHLCTPDIARTFHLDNRAVGLMASLVRLGGMMAFFLVMYSDRIGRKWLIACGLWLVALGILGVLLMQGFAIWLAAAALMGIGMAMLYPNIIAAVNDISDPRWRGASLGVYRYWRDTGYAIGGILLGLVAQLASQITPAFWTTAALLVLSGAWIGFYSEEIHPKFNPAEN